MSLDLLLRGGYWNKPDAMGTGDRAKRRARNFTTPFIPVEGSKS